MWSQTYQYAAHRLSPSEAITCTFAAGNRIAYVYYHGQDVTGLVLGEINDSNAEKLVELSRMHGAHLVITVRHWGASVNFCTSASFQIKCANGMTLALGWETFGPSSALSKVRRAGGGTGRSAASRRFSSPRSLPNAAWLPQIWASNSAKYAAFRLCDIDAWEPAPNSEWDYSTLHYDASVWSESSSQPVGTGAANENTVTEASTSLHVTRIKLVVKAHSAVITLPRRATGNLHKDPLQSLGNASSGSLQVVL